MTEQAAGETVTHVWLVTTLGKHDSEIVGVYGSKAAAEDVADTLRSGRMEWEGAYAYGFLVSEHVVL